MRVTENSLTLGVQGCNGPDFDRCSLPFPQIPGHQSVFINEPRLSDFKQVLLREGIQAEFVGGVLVCNNMVAVRRVSVLSTGLVSVLSVRHVQHLSPQALDKESGQH